MKHIKTQSAFIIFTLAFACLLSASVQAQSQTRDTPTSNDTPTSSDADSEPATQQTEDDEPLTVDSEEAARREIKIQVARLTARDPVARLRAAEQLARFSAVENRRLVESYRFQEKDKRVQLALDWTLHRMGDSEALARIADALPAQARRAQAMSYLSKLDAPEQLYPFLDSPKREIRVGVITALGKIGNENTHRKLETQVGKTKDSTTVIALHDAMKELESKQLEINDAPTRPRTVTTTAPPQ